MSYLNRLGFDKGDERELSISLYSARIAWIFTTIILVVWSLKDILSTGSLSFQFVVFSASQTVFWTSYLYYKRKLGG